MTLSGLFIPLITPFTPDGDVALPALETLAHEVLDTGATGLLALGTTGEPSSLTTAERAAVLAVIERVSHDRHTPWIAGAHDGLDPGSADAVMYAVPAFVRPGEEGVIAHFTALAATSPAPVVVYHVPYRTAQPLSADALFRLASLPGVTAMKYAPGILDPSAIAFLAAADSLPGFSLLAGDDVLAGPLLALGAAGAVMAAAHIATAGYAALTAAWHSGGLPTARAASHRLAPLSAALFAAPNPTVIKAVLHAHGRIPSPSVRLPLTAAPPDLVDRAVAATSDQAHPAGPEPAVSDQSHRAETCRQPARTA